MNEQQNAGCAAAVGQLENSCTTGEPPLNTEPGAVSDRMLESTNGSSPKLLIKSASQFLLEC